MLNKRMISLGFIFGLLMNASFAAKNINLTLGSGIDFHFKVNQSQVFTNTFPWTLNVECTLYCNNKLKNTLEFTVLKKNGSLNDMPVYSGDNMSMDIHHLDKFKISAVSGARVQLMNKGEGEVTAICNITN